MNQYQLLFCLTILWGIAEPSLASTSSTDNKAQHAKVYLHTGWEFKQAGTPQWLPAEVPGCVHTDLLKNNQIEDPFYRDNETKLQWIGKTDWEYRLKFEVTPQLLQYNHIELTCLGLDTYTDIYLNSQQVLSTDNMFREYRLECKEFLKKGDNELLIRFRSPINEVLPIMKQKSYQLPTVNDPGEKTSPYTRKAPYHFGWDWGPRFVTCGIWRPIFLDCWNEVKITDLFISTEHLTDQTAILVADLEVVSEAEQLVTIELQDLTENKVRLEKRVLLQKGISHTPIKFSIDQPRRWWPNGLGEQFLYQIRTTILKDGKVLDSFQRTIGLRTLELRQQPDEWGTSFTFVINDVPVYAKGGNWIPADNFVTRISDEKYKHLLQSCREANMNMLRVWGGGIYESNVFYGLCDQLGLMVWQDFMFACSMYPGDPEFLNNVEQEARDQLIRLRNHPSIVLWCGNNEVETGWFNWGWKNRLPEAAWQDYLKLFHDLLPKICQLYDPTRPYWPSSPSSNLKEPADSQKSGDVHYWDVWHGTKPFIEFKRQFPRFISEYGFQSFPAPESIAQFTLPEDRRIDSPVMLVHQKSGRGNKLIEEYLLRDFPKPKNFDSFAVVSQILQAEGIKLGTEHFRRIKPRCMGSLYWQIDDCWPVASWSSIDYYGTWKALHYYAKKFYNDILVSPDMNDEQIQVYLVSDRNEPVKGNLHVGLYNFDGHKLFYQSKQVELAPLESEAVFSFSRKELLSRQNLKTCFLYGEFEMNGEIVSSNQLYFLPAKELSLPRPEIRLRVEPMAGGMKLFLSSNKLARNVYLSSPRIKGFFNDNFFDLFPNREVIIEFHSQKETSLKEFQKQLRIQSLVDFF
ncbi:MAG: ABC transporter permease [candidate division KSB1 bacterium]|nr:ABC transporter permease [candidate division KSB1 bacterium]